MSKKLGGWGKIIGPSLVNSLRQARTATAWRWRVHVFTQTDCVYFVNNGAPVFAAFLDASSTVFHKTYHNLLCAKLIECNVPACIVKLLMSWFRHQTIQIKWATNFSSSFTVTNGVRKAGVLSPYLFGVYSDELSQSSWAHPKLFALWAIWLWMIWCLLTTYVHRTSMLSEYLLWLCCWIPNRILFATKELVHLFNLNSTNNLLHRICLKWCTCNNFLTLVYREMPHWRISRDNWNCCTVQETRSKAPLLSAQLQKKHCIPCLFHANACLPVVEQIHKD